jgi:hypothetical protein
MVEYVWLMDVWKYVWILQQLIFTAIGLFLLFFAFCRFVSLLQVVLEGNLQEPGTQTILDLACWMKLDSASACDNRRPVRLMALQEEREKLEAQSPQLGVAGDTWRLCNAAKPRMRKTHEHMNRITRQP